MKELYFPMQTLRVTQGYGVAYSGVPANTYSHAGGYALDLGGADGGADWLYAPCDMVVRRVYGSYNAVWFESLEELESIGSTVIMLCLHMNLADRIALGIRPGKVFKAGQRCYREGMAGKVTGTHVHLELGKGPFTGTGWKQNAQGVWVINNPLVPSEVFTLKGDVNVMNDGGYNWMVNKALSTEPVLMQCVASIGDQKIIGAAMDGLGIGYKVECNTITTLVPVSPGDQRALVAAARPLGIAWNIPMPDNQTDAEKRAEEAEKENEQLRAKLAKAEERAKNEAVRADRAEATSAELFRIIESVKAALNVK